MQIKLRAALSRRFRFASPLLAGVLAVGLLAPAAASAQAPDPGAGGKGGAAMQAKQKQMMELRQVQQKLDGIREEAMAKPALKKQQAALKEQIDEAMVEENPKAEKQIDRFEKLRGEFSEARKDGNQDKAKELAGELQELGQSLQKTQAKVMQREEIKSATESFQKKLVAQMKEVDPETEQLMARARSLSQQLRGGMMMPSPGK